jgi:putative ABC transport system permease protein
MRDLDALGTNLLTVRAGQGFGQNQPEIPENAPLMIKRIAPVYEVSTVSRIPGSVFRNDIIDDGRTRGITILAADLNLIATQRGTIRDGKYLDAVSSEFPMVVLGSVAAERLGIDTVSRHQKLWLGEQWFTVIGILNPLTLAADLDRSAIIGYGSARQFLGHDSSIEVIYVRSYPEHVHDVRSVMAATVNPGNPEEVMVSRASDVLEAKAAASNSFTNLFLGLGTVALLVGGIGIANVMVIAVIERRNEIGLRRALGATKFHIGVQFLTESLLLASIGGIAGILLGIFITGIYAYIQDLYLVLPAYAIVSGMISSMLIGGFAGFYPALKASNMSPTEALRTK